MANAALALTFSDQIEAALGMTPTTEDQLRLKESFPKLRTVDKGTRDSGLDSSR